METLEITRLDEAGLAESGETSASAVSWSPVFAGAIVAAAATLVLLLMGSGLGLTMVSPWSNKGVGPGTFAASTAIWLIIVQWLSSTLGGYLTGRLRKRWAGVHAHEVFFRDTAHGLLMWALATILVAGVLSSVASTLITEGAGATTSLATEAARDPAQFVSDRATNEPALSADYYADLMFRQPAERTLSAKPATVSQNVIDPRPEASRILKTDLASGSVSSADRSYLAQLVSMRTGRTAADAQQRVDDVITQIDQARAKVREAINQEKVRAKEIADAARKAGVTTSLLAVLSLLIGAFVASAAAALGGRERDESPLLD
jgi:hypothetical protein